MSLYLQQKKWDFLYHKFKKICHISQHQFLKTFVQTITDSIREKVDWIVRYGGEEFMIVLPETNIGGATIIAEKITNDKGALL